MFLCVLRRRKQRACARVRVWPVRVRGACVKDCGDILTRSTVDVLALPLCCRLTACCRRKLKQLWLQGLRNRFKVLVVETLLSLLHYCLFCRCSLS